MHLYFEEGSINFQGYTEIQFELTSLPEVLPLDFMAASLNRAVINGFPVR